MPGDRFAGRSLWLRIRRNGGLYLLMIPAMIIFICFTYLPMYGIVIAFKNFKPARGILGSEWAGLRYFKKYFSSYMFSNTIRNTLVISIYTILVTFPLPILIALMCNQMYAKRFKKFFQVSTYLPHFISTVVMCGMIVLFLSPSSGVIPKLLGYIGVQTGDLMGKASAFSSIYVWTEAWQHVGWDSIMYIAALSAVDPQLYEAAVVDGANKWQIFWKITMPYVLFICGPSLVQGVISNINNFNVIYLLTSANATANMAFANSNAKETDLLITWLFTLTNDNSNYKMASVIGIISFVICALLTLLSYSRMISGDKEEVYQ